MNRLHPVVRLALWTAFLAVTLRLLHGTTMGTLSVPAGSLDGLAAWVDRTSPAVMAVSLLRLVALIGAWYLAVVTVATVVADVAGWNGLARLVAAASPAVVRRVATRSAGAGLVAGAFLAAVPLPAPLDSAPSLDTPSGLAIRPAGAAPGPPDAAPAGDLRTGGAPAGPHAGTAAGTDPTSSDNMGAPTAVSPDRTPSTATMARAGGDAGDTAVPAGPTTEPTDPRVRAPAASHTSTATMAHTGAHPPAPAESARAPAGPLAEPAVPHASGARPATATMTYAQAAPQPDAGAAPPTTGPEPTGNPGGPAPTASPAGTATMTYAAADDDERPPADGPRPAPERPTASADRPTPANGTARSTTGRSGDERTVGPTSRDPGRATSRTAPDAHGHADLMPSSAAPAGEGHRGRPDGPTDEAWVVGPGDSFWSVAAETLADRAGGAAPADAEVERYWRALLDANRSRMADPANPDLLIPGQELTLPST